MLSVPPRKSELTWPVTDDWKDRVKLELEKRGRGAARSMATAIGCSTGNLTGLLAGASKQSHLVPKIHQYLGWPPPLLPLASVDTGEITYLLERLNPVDREAAKAMLRGFINEKTKQ